MQDDGSTESLVGFCFRGCVAYLVLSGIFFIVTFWIALATLQRDSYRFNGMASGGYFAICLALSFFFLSPVTLLSILSYDAYRQRRRQKEKRKNDDL